MRHRKNHVASSFYLARWAGQDGRLCVVTPPVLESKPAKPQSVGYRVDLWGRDSKVRQAVEEALGQVESDAAGVLRRLAKSWPLERGKDDWFALAYLPAIHLLRAPYARRRMLSLQESALKRQLPRFRHWTDEQADEFVGTVTSDSWHAQLFNEQLPQVATLVGSMHWTLVEFRDEVLATSDQPVTVVPLLDAVHSPPRATPGDGACRLRGDPDGARSASRTRAYLAQRTR